MCAYVPLPTPVLIQLPESESSNGESSLLARGMDYDKIGYIHSGKGWVRQTCREHQEKRADWCRIVELSDFMAPTQKAGIQLKEAKGAAGSRNAYKLVLDGYYTGAPAGITAELLGLRPRAHWPK